MISGSAVITANAYGDDQVEVMVGGYEKTVTTTIVGAPVVLTGRSSHIVITPDP